MKKSTGLPEKVIVNDSFWTPIQNMMIDSVLPYQIDVLEDKVEGVEKSHAVENFRIAAGLADGDFYGMVFQDSDVAKWLEAVAYALQLKPDAALEQKADEIIGFIGKAQEADGYLNTYFTIKEPEHKWQNLTECHELYCAGHMMEAAVAYYETTGKTVFLEIMRRNADLICKLFGDKKGQVRGVPGHQEVELGLLRMYDATGEERYLKTALYFLDERGRQPEYIAEEIKNRDWYHWCRDQDPIYNQRHLPVREQKDAVGHSVRAVYMYAAMAELAALTGDKELAQACQTLWDSIINRRMYITGGIGSTVHGEAFSADYELPNDLIYAETCASIAMVFFARRMLEITPDGEYADIIEKELYNGILSGMQMDGKHFFYVNPLEVVPGVSGILPEYKHALPSRPVWYGCACCPPNIARLITSLGKYAWGENEDIIFAHIYLGGEVVFSHKDGVRILCESGYPWQGDIKYTVHPVNKDVEFSFAVHIPGFCKSWEVRINGRKFKCDLSKGYVYIKRCWNTGDIVEINLEITPGRIYADPKVRANAGCVAIMRGSVVYCFEETDNGDNLAALRILRDSALICKNETLGNIGNTVTIETKGARLQSSGTLYSDTPPESVPVLLKAVPYYKWGNRKEGGMRVWLGEI